MGESVVYAFPASQFLGSSINLEDWPALVFSIHIGLCFDWVLLIYSLDITLPFSNQFVQVQIPLLGTGLIHCNHMTINSLVCMLGDVFLGPWGVKNLLGGSCFQDFSGLNERISAGTRILSWSFLNRESLHGMILA